jgi:hypothetical protein
MTMDASEKSKGPSGSSDDGGLARLSYEAPTLTLVGNARDLLAGGAGTRPDADPPPSSQAGG